MGQTRTERSRRWIEMVQELGLLKNHVQRVDFFPLVRLQTLHLQTGK